LRVQNDLPKAIVIYMVRNPFLNCSIGKNYASLSIRLYTISYHFECCVFYYLCHYAITIS